MDGQMSTHRVRGTERAVRRFLGFCSRYPDFRSSEERIGGELYASVELPLSEHRVKAMIRDYYGLTYVEPEDKSLLKSLRR